MRSLSCPFLSLRPNLQQRIPRARAQRLSVLADAEARHAVLVRALVVDFLSRERVPDVAVIIVVAREEVLSREREGHRGDSAQYLIIRVHIHLAVRAHIEEAA